MTTRESVYVARRIPFESPPPPNQTKDVISCEMRLFYPPNADKRELVRFMSEILIDAIKQLSEKPEPELRNVWVKPPETESKVA